VTLISFVYESSPVGPHSCKNRPISFYRGQLSLSLAFLFIYVSFLRLNYCIVACLVFVFLWGFVCLFNSCWLGRTSFKWQFMSVLSYVMLNLNSVNKLFEFGTVLLALPWIGFVNEFVYSCSVGSHILGDLLLLACVLQTVIYSV